MGKLQMHRGRRPRSFSLGVGHSTSTWVRTWGRAMPVCKRQRRSAGTWQQGEEGIMPSSCSRSSCAPASRQVPVLGLMAGGAHAGQTRFDDGRLSPCEPKGLVCYDLLSIWREGQVFKRARRGIWVWIEAEVGARCSRTWLRCGGAATVP